VLSSDPIHTNVWVSAAKWTPKGNLVMFTGPRVAHDTLFATSHLLTTAVSQALPDDPKISSRLNVKWGKVLINSVPTSIIKGHLHAHLPPTCWQVLIDNNPSLCHLKVCQLPSWVHHLSLFTTNLASSLVLTFENPDRTITPSLIKSRFLYAFGTQCCIKAWHQPSLSPAKSEAMKLAKDLQSTLSAALAAPDQCDIARSMLVSTMQLSAAKAVDVHTLLELVTNATFSSTGNKQSPSSPPKPSLSKKKKGKSG